MPARTRSTALFTAYMAGLVAFAGAQGCGSELEGDAPERELDVAEVEEVEPEVEVEPDIAEVEPEVEVEPDIAEVEPEVDAAPEVAETEDDVGPDSDDVEVAPPAPCDDKDEGEGCDDGDLCTLGDRCVAGACLPLEALACDDGNVCTDDTCMPDVGCVRLDNLAACDDGDPCTAGDRCSAGKCRPGGGSCDDGNPCTRDACDADGDCSNVADDSLSCADASECSAGDFCADGVCMSGPADGCAEDDPCVSNFCSDDGLTCELTLLDGEVCDDGDACTTEDKCSGGLCRAGVTLKCPWDTECAAYRCDRNDGCLLDTTYQEGKTCSDDDRCTTGEKCDGNGVCLPVEAAVCDDDNLCTEDSCDATWGCEHSWLSGPCDDNSDCTVDDQCQFAQCRGTNIVCDDGNFCTSDSCDPLIGCQRLALSCDDDNACTDDSCDPANGCRHTPRSGSCSDGLACTVLETCLAGVCVAGATTCDDDDACTVDVCDAEEGCQNVPLDPCPIGELRLTGVGVNGNADGLGQWIAIANDGGVSFELDGYAIRGESCDCEAVIDDGIRVAPNLTVYGLRKSSPPPADASIAPGGPATADDFDFVFGAPGDGFAIDAGGDRIELIAPGGEVVDAIDVP